MRSGPELSVIDVRSGLVSGVDELTDIGGSGSLILDAGGGTDIEVAAELVWLNTAPSWGFGEQSGSFAPSAIHSCCVAHYLCRPSMILSG